MIHTDRVIVVEGKYDKIKLSSFIDGMIIETRGFRIFKDKEQMALIRKMADARGLLILTDSDSAGFLIRNYLKSCIAPDKIKHAYIPDILGKERRKTSYSKEGKLGVEGMSEQVLTQALSQAGIGVSFRQAPSEPITKMDLFDWGLSGKEDSAAKRKQLTRELGLPEHLTTNALVTVLSALMSRREWQSLCERLFL